MKNIEMELKVYSENDREPICLSEDGDGLGCVRMFTSGAEAVAYWGKLDLMLSPQMARDLAAGLNKMVAYLEEQGQ